MKEFKKVLVPLDYSPEAIKVLIPYAKYLAEKFGAELHLYHVQETIELSGELDLPMNYFEKFANDALAAAKKHMEKTVKENFSGMNVKTDFATGDAASHIVSYADKNNFDLILMGTHGRKGLDKIVFGSVAYRVAKKATCPVLTVNQYKVKV
jgi:nucleotide-binding universal stress UspA family protein